MHGRDFIIKIVDIRGNLDPEDRWIEIYIDVYMAD